MSEGEFAIKKIGRNQIVYEMGTKNAPVLKVDCGETITVATEDCFSYRLVNDTDVLEECLDFSKVNPASGPIYVQGAKPGDTLKVRIEKITLAEQGVAVAMNGLGVLGHLVKGSNVKIIPIEEDAVIFNDLRIPLRPMIGVIGVAPAEGTVPNSTPGDHGGNMDTIDIGPGAIVYLPVFQEGAYFALGDLHAAMGNGEVCGTGVECRGQVELSFELCTARNWSIPVVETSDAFNFVGSAETLDGATEKAVAEAVRFLKQEHSIPWHEAYMLASIATDVIVSQAVNPLKTVRVRVPKTIL